MIVHVDAPVLADTAPIVMQLGGWKTEKMMRRSAAVTDQILREVPEAVSGQRVGTLLARQTRLTSRQGPIT